jgi:hypothetical protein
MPFRAEESVARVTINQNEYHRRLPLVCVRCGKPAMAWIPKKFEMIPLWRLLFLPMLIILPFLSREATIDLPVCEAHSDPWREHDRFRRHFLAVFSAGLLLLMATSVFLASTSSPRKEPEAILVTIGFLSGAWFVALFGLAIAYLAFRFLSIRVVRISTDSLTLKNVNAAFVETLIRERRDGPSSGDTLWSPPGMTDERIRS